MIWNKLRLGKEINTKCKTVAKMGKGILFVMHQISTGPPGTTTSVHLIYGSAKTERIRSKVIKCTKSRKMSSLKSRSAILDSGNSNPSKPLKVRFNLFNATKPLGGTASCKCWAFWKLSSCTIGSTTAGSLKSLSFSRATRPWERKPKNRKNVSKIIRKNMFKLCTSSSDKISWQELILYFLVVSLNKIVK